MRDWKALVHRHVPVTGDEGLPQHTIDELAAHLRTSTRRARAGRSEAEAFRTGRGGARGIGRGAAACAMATHQDARGALDQPPIDGDRNDRNGRRPQVRLTPVAPGPVFCCGRHPHPRPRCGRRDGDLQHRQFRAAPSAAVPRPRAARDDLGEQRRKGVAEGAAVAGELHGLSKYAVCVQGGGGVVAARGEPCRARARADAGQYH